jgi:hypothetical protein
MLTLTTFIVLKVGGVNIFKFVIEGYQYRGVVRGALTWINRAPGRALLRRGFSHRLLAKAVIGNVYFGFALTASAGSFSAADTAARQCRN